MRCGVAGPRWESGLRPSERQHQQPTRRSRVRVPPSSTMSEERTHKAHRPSQSGKKKKEKNSGFNGKVPGQLLDVVSTPHHLSSRRSHLDPGAERKDKVDVLQKKIKVVCTSLLSIALPMTSLHRS